MLSTTQSVAKIELQLVAFRFDFTSKLFQPLEQFVPSTAQRKNNSSYTAAIRFKFNFKVNEVLQPLNNFSLSTTQPVKSHLIQVFSFWTPFHGKIISSLGELFAVDHAIRCRKRTSNRCASIRFHFEIVSSFGEIFAFGCATKK